MKLLSNKEEADIVRYLDKEMTAEEQAEFKNALAENDALKQGVEIEKEIRFLGETAGKKIKTHYTNDEGSRDEEIAAMIKRAGERWELENPDAHQGHFATLKSLFSKKYIAIAATIIGIVILSTLYLFTNNENTQFATNKNPDSTKSLITQDSSFQKSSQAAIAKKKMSISNDKKNALFAQYFKPDVTPPADHLEAIQEPLAYYEAAQYSDAITAFENVDPDFLSRGNDVDKKLVQFYSWYYKSLSYLANHNTSKAIAGFHKTLGQSPDKYSTAKTNWYLALAHLKAGNVKKAENILTQLASNGQAGQYAKKAAMLKTAIIKE